MFRVYVGNLPYSVRDAELKDFFEKAGCKVVEGEATVVMMPDGRSKGFGFVTFQDEESFNKALALSGTDMQGRSVRVDAARPKEDRGDRPMGGSPMPAAKPMPTDDDKADEMMDEKDEEDEKEEETDEDKKDDEEEVEA
jgi:nucleolin